MEDTGQSQHCQLLVAPALKMPLRESLTQPDTAMVSDAHSLADQSPAKGRMASPVTCPDEATVLGGRAQPHSPCFCA